MSILDVVMALVEVPVVYFAIVMLTRYVFLENGLINRKYKVYHTIFLLLIAISRFAVSENDAWELIAIICVGIIILLGRLEDNDSVLGALLAFPIMGFAEGILYPLAEMPASVFIKDQIAGYAYRIIVYAVLLVACWYVYQHNRELRKKFVDELRERELKFWERVMLCTVGTLLLTYSTFMNSINSFASGDSGQVVAMVVVMGICCFIMSVTVIMVIVIGNKHNYYHDCYAQVQDNIIIFMAELVENRDENTGGHIKRTAIYVDIIAKQLRRNGMFEDILTDEYIKDIKSAAPLHDIGKIRVPDAILNKPGRLTDEEFALMKEHAESGRVLLDHAKEHLGNLRYLDIATDMAGYHHEWWDGGPKGYPGHLKGEEIPLCARIMAVADVFDALTTQRCYKEPMKLEKAYDIIRSESGTHFDPVVVDAFFDDLKRIKAAYGKFAYENKVKGITTTTKLQEKRLGNLKYGGNNEIKKN